MSDFKTSLEVIAPTVEEAVEKGAAELGFPVEDLDVQILDGGGGGLFGIGNRQARVRVSLKDAESETSESTPVAAGEDVSGLIISDDETEDDQEVLRITYDTIIELLQRMDIAANIEAKWGEADEPGKLRPLLVEINGDDLSLLIGQRGETLNALQYITRLIVGKEVRRPVPVVIDVEGYRARREAQLRRIAQQAADQTVERERSMALEPMPPNERRIIHIELKDHPDVYTESVGEGDHRKVTIIPRS